MISFSSRNADFVGTSTSMGVITDGSVMDPRYKCWSEGVSETLCCGGIFDNEEGEDLRAMTVLFG